MIHLSGIDPEKKVNVITKEERMNFVHLIKHFTVTLTGLRDFKEAIITRGGVKVKEVNLRWSQSWYRDCILQGKCWIWMH